MIKLLERYRQMAVMNDLIVLWNYLLEYIFDQTLKNIFLFKKIKQGVWCDHGCLNLSWKSILNCDQVVKESWLSLYHCSSCSLSFSFNKTCNTWSGSLVKDLILSIFSICSSTSYERLPVKLFNHIVSISFLSVKRISICSTSIARRRYSWLNCKTWYSSNDICRSNDETFPLFF